MTVNNVFVKVKRERKQPLFKMLSDHTLFNTLEIDVDSCIEYNPDHNLDEDAWFKVEQFSHKPFCIDFLKLNFDSKDYSDLKKGQFSKIAFVFSTQGNNFYFQKLTPSLFICRKTIAFGDVATVEENGNRLLVNTQPDAVYFKDLDTLVFRNLSTIASIFKGIDELFKEATNEDVGKFLGESFISLSAGYGIDSVSKPNRKRIALAIESLEKMSEQDRIDILSYINAYCHEKLYFDPNDNTFEVSKDNELKLLLYGVEQRFYTTPFGKEKRLANSIQTVS